MSIQQSINQAIGIAGALATQTPMAAAHREKVLNKAALKEEEKNLVSKQKVLQKVIKESNNDENPDVHKLGVGMEAMREQTASLKRLQELNPKEYTKTYVESATTLGKAEEGYQDILEYREKQKIKAEQQKDAKNARRRAQYALKKAEQEAKADLEVRVQAKQKGRSKMGFETRKSVILDQYANPLEVKNER